MWILKFKNRSIYSAIKSNSNTAEQFVKSAVSGDIDGLVVYGSEPRRAANISPLKEIIITAVSKNPKPCVKLLDDFMKNSDRAIYYTAPLNKWIKENDNIISVQKLYKFAISVLKNSENIEAVKLGLSICQCINMDKDEAGKDIVHLLALCEELTLFCIYAMHSWSNRNDEIFKLAQVLTGWGKIHAVNFLEPKTDEIKFWLLYNGCNNSVSPVYSAYNVAEKIDMLDIMMSENFSHKQFLPVTQIMLSLIKKEPVDGMLELENSHKVIEKYIDTAQELCTSQADYNAIYIIALYLKEQIKLSPRNSSKLLYNRCMSILTSDKCCELVEQLIVDGKALDLAEFIGIDLSGTAFQMLETDFYKNIEMLERISSEEYMLKVLELGRTVLDISFSPGAYPINPTDKKYSTIEHILSTLKKFPGKGEDYVKYAILSPCYNCRVMATNTLLEWNNRGYVFTRDILDAIHKVNN